MPDNAAKRVEAIHEELQWEMGSGQRAEHLFALSPNGDPVLRKITERWKSAAPSEDATWEYWPSRPPRPEATLEYGGHPMRLDECSLAWEVIRIELSTRECASSPRSHIA